MLGNHNYDLILRCKTHQRHTETSAAKSGISTKAINETMLFFANFLHE